MSPDEAELWARVASTVRPIARRPTVAPEEAVSSAIATPAIKSPPGKQPKRARPALAAPPPPSAPPPAVPSLDRNTLDASWDRKLARGLVGPDFTLDLHGASLDSAYSRLDHGLTLALAQGARLVLVITGRSRGHVDPADRGSRRGAIRAKFLDWLTHGSHASRIAAVRPAHPRHGGPGAVYIVLRKAK